MWYPDSAAKTAQAIEEFDREGLPLFILANWRGFSGGQRDLFEGILQVQRFITALSQSAPTGKGKDPTCAAPGQSSQLCKGLTACS